MSYSESRPSLAEASSELRSTVDEYFESQPQITGRTNVADDVLALLRIGTREARNMAEELMGRPITKCPSAVPPWPPRPVARPPQKQKLTRVDRNPCLPTTPAFQRYKLLTVGMTKDQALGRGISRRDLRVWEKNGHLEFK